VTARAARAVISVAVVCFPLDILHTFELAAVFVRCETNHRPNDESNAFRYNVVRHCILWFYSRSIGKTSMPGIRIDALRYSERMLTAMRRQRRELGNLVRERY
jgi:hypothetical protein